MHMRGCLKYSHNNLKQVGTKSALHDVAGGFVQFSGTTQDTLHWGHR